MLNIWMDNWEAAVPSPGAGAPGLPPGNGGRGFISQPRDRGQRRAAAARLAAPDGVLHEGVIKTPVHD